MTPRARTEGLSIETVDDDLLVYDLDRARAHRLNATAALVWRSADGRRSVADLAEVLRRDLDAAADENLVLCSLDRLAGAGLLEAAPQRAADAVRASRREFVRKVGAVGALSLLLPMVTSIAAPTRAQAQSGPGTCNSESECSCQSNSSCGTGTTSNTNSQSDCTTQSDTACQSASGSNSGSS
jgi:hypothetical protein